MTILPTIEAAAAPAPDGMVPITTELPPDGSVVDSVTQPGVVAGADTNLELVPPVPDGDSSSVSEAPKDVLAPAPVPPAAPDSLVSPKAVVPPRNEKDFLKINFANRDKVAILLLSG